MSSERTKGNCVCVCVCVCVCLYVVEEERYGNIYIEKEKRNKDTYF